VFDILYLYDMKDQIIKLRKEGKTYQEIADKIGVAKSTISYHCKNEGLGNAPIKTADIEELQEYYKTHTKAETAKHFNVTLHYVKTYGNKRSIKYTPEERKAASVKAGKKRRYRIKADAVKSLGGKCSICGYDKCEDALDFHHVDPKEKSFALSLAYRHTQKEIDLELKKCILVCANCHREIHSKK